VTASRCWKWCDPIASGNRPFDSRQALSFLNDLEARLPTQTVRSEEQGASALLDAAGLAWLATHLADIHRRYRA
jgi:hypothetical protein